MHDYGTDYFLYRGNIMIVAYSDDKKNDWDELVLERSINGSFLQTRRFLEYHGNRFDDASLMFYRNGNLIAVIPFSFHEGEENKGEFRSHNGATFGGIIVHERYGTIEIYKQILSELFEYCNNEGTHILLKMPSKIYTRLDKNTDMLEYLLRNCGYSVSEDVGFYIKLGELEDDFVKNYSTLRRRKLKKSMKYDLAFKEINSDSEVGEFYQVLQKNYLKFGCDPVHTLNELLVLKNNKLKNETRFFGVYLENRLIAGSMVFDFNNRTTFHTQYLASDNDYYAVCPNEYMYTELIRQAKKDEYRYLSFGTSTYEHGKVLNENLAIFKEGFNTEAYLNRTYKLKIT